MDDANETACDCCGEITSMHLTGDDIARLHVYRALHMGYVNAMLDKAIRESKARQAAILARAKATAETN